MPPSRTTRPRNTELAEALDRIMNKGAVLRGDLVLTVADVDLLYLDLRLLVSAVDTAFGPPDSSASDADVSPPSHA